MLAAVLFGALLQAGEGSYYPTGHIMPQIRTWSFLTAEDRDLTYKIEATLNSRAFIRAGELNEELMSHAPLAIFNPDEDLPVMVIQKSGQGNQTQTGQAKVDGWKWRLENAWLFAYGQDGPGASRRFKVIAEGSSEYSTIAWEARVMVHTRMADYKGARKILNESPISASGIGNVLDLANAGQWPKLHEIAMGGGLGIQPSLKGGIGGRFQMRLQQLPPTTGGGDGGNVPVQPIQNSQTSSSATVEAALILGEYSLRRHDLGQARLYLTRVLQVAKEAFPHHRRMADIYWRKHIN